MSSLSLFLPLLLRYEGSCIPRDGETLAEAFSRCRERSWCNDAADPGGATMMGVTLATLSRYRRIVLSDPAATATVDELRRLDYDTWQQIVELFYWNPLRCPLLPFNGPALMLADWYWHSGSAAIRRLQRLLNDMGSQSKSPRFAAPLVIDGIYGRKTFNALCRQLSTRPRMFRLLDALLEARLSHFDDIVRARPSSARFRAGWEERARHLHRTALTADPLPRR